MSKNDNLVNLYNKSENLIMISSFPAREDRSIQKINAVASYADHLVPELKSHLAKSQRKLVIIAEILDKPCIYEESDVLVVRCWRKNSLFVFFDILRTLKLFSNAARVFIQFEFNMFGKHLCTLTFLPFLVLLRAFGFNVTLLLHQVLLDISELSGHINLSKGSLKVFVLNGILRFYYFLTLQLSHKVIVHDNILRTRLNSVSSVEVFVVPHGLGEYKNQYSQEQARALLDIPSDSFVVLCFGFLTWYKGSDWIVEVCSKNCTEMYHKKCRLVMAGGMSANLQNEVFYKNYYSEVVAKASTCDAITITGFVPDSEVSKYMSSADICVLPYRTQMSASGPLALAVAFGKPFLVSTQMHGVLETDDISAVMSKHDVTEDDLMFELDEEKFFEKLYKLHSNKDQLAKLSHISFDLSKERDWQVVARKFLNVIDK